MPLRLAVTRVARRTVDVLLLLLVGTVLGTLVLACVLPAILGGATFVVGGGSMEPSVPTGAAILAVPVAPGDLAPGDIVSMKVGEPRAVFTHRITRLVPREDGLWLATKGDANPDADPSLVPATSVIGRVSVVVPWAGYLVVLLNSIQGIVLAVSVGVLLLAGAWYLETLEDDLAESLRGASPTGLAPGAPAPSTGQGIAG